MRKKSLITLLIVSLITLGIFTYKWGLTEASLLAVADQCVMNDCYEKCNYEISCIVPCEDAELQKWNACIKNQAQQNSNQQLIIPPEMLCTQPLQIPCDVNCSSSAGTAGYASCNTTCENDNALRVRMYQDCLAGQGQQQQPTPPQPTPPEPTPPVDVQKENGEIIIYSSDIKNGETITAGKNEKKRIIFSNGAETVLAPGASITIKDVTWLDVLKGKLMFMLKHPLDAQGLRFKVTSRTAVASVRGTKFLLSANKTNTIIQVTEGLLDVSDLKGKKTVEVAAGYQTTVGKKGPSKPVKFKQKNLIMK